MTDPFATLGLAPTFNLADGVLQRAYLARVAACHPDLASGDPERAAEAARTSAELNEARRLLLHPESRARVLLERLGGSGGEGRDLPEGFLMQMMETRMALEEAAAAGDAEEIATWRAWAARERASFITSVGALFPEGDSALSPETAGEIRRLLNAWRYVERMIEQLPRGG